MARSKKAKASTKSKKPKTNTKKYAEADMQAAIAEIKANPGVNKKATFIKYNIPPTTGNDRLKGSISREESDKSRRKFNDYEEDCLVEWIRLEASFNKPPTPIVVRRMAEDFYFSIHDKFEKMGQTWLECFVARRPEIAKATGVPIEHLRVVGANKKSINEFFDRLEKIQEEHHFEPQDIFNFDETSIILSRRKNEIVIGASGEKGDPKSIPVVGFSDRESCTVVECCSAAGQRLPAYVIFKGNNVCAHWIANKDFAIEANLTTSFSAESTTLAEPTILAESTTLADETVSGEVAGESTVFAAESTILIDDDTIDSGSVSCDDAVGYNSSSDSDLDSDDETPVHQCSEPNCSDQIVDDSDSFAEFDGDGKTSFEATSAPEEANAGLFDDISRWKLAASRKGWMNASLCLEWLKHFVKHSKSSRSDGKRLLICDGLRAHDAAAFRELCDENNIVLLILPPHCSHVLQPLDLNVFGKVKNKYKSKIGDLVCDKKHKKVIKRAFMIFYGQSRQEHFTPENIRIAWSMSGIVPLNRDKPLNSRLLLDSGEPVVSSESNDEPVLVDSDVDESVNLRTVMDLLTKVKKSGQERGFSLAEMSNVDKLIEIANGGLGGLFEKALESRQKRIQNVNMLNTPPDIRNSIIKPKDGEMDHELGQCWKRTYKKGTTEYLDTAKRKKSNPPTTTDTTAIATDTTATTNSSTATTNSTTTNSSTATDSTTNYSTATDSTTNSTTTNSTTTNSSTATDSTTNYSTATDSTTNSTTTNSSTANSSTTNSSTAANAGTTARSTRATSCTTTTNSSSTVASSGSANTSTRVTRSRTTTRSTTARKSTTVSTILPPVSSGPLKNITNTVSARSRRVKTASKK